MPQLRRYVVTAVMQSGTFLETINNKYWAIIVDLEIWVHGLFTFIHEYILYFILSLCSGSERVGDPLKLRGMLPC